VSHFGVHSPYEAKDEMTAHFKEKPPVGGHRNPVYAAMIKSVDESVGRVMATLDELGLAENTLVVFTSDNGGVGGYDREGIGKRNGDTTDNAPLRGGKGMLYEGGVRVPYVFRWKGTIAPGKVTDRPINTVDLYPTLLELTGAPKPDQPLDGESYVAVLRGEGKPRGPLYWHFPGYLGQGADQWRTTPAGSIRDGDWKLLEFFEDGHVELYNLREDVGEKHDLAKEQPGRVAELKQKLVAWRESVGAKMPGKNEGGAKPPGKGGKRRRATAEDE
jgi:arylsulfatase A-like enzyme